jgi:hypothetical protein
VFKVGFVVVLVERLVLPQVVGIELLLVELRVQLQEVEIEVLLVERLVQTAERVFLGILPSVEAASGVVNPVLKREVGFLELLVETVFVLAALALIKRDI